MASELREKSPYSAPPVGTVSATSDVHYRPLRSSDATAIRSICCETGFLGQDVGPVCSDRELFAEIMVDPYLEYAPEWGFVAEHEMCIIGYLLGAPPNFDPYVIRVAAPATLKMLARSSAGAYHNHPQTVHFLHWLLFHSYRERPLRPAHAAHMHFNVRSPERGHFVGVHLWQRFEQMLRRRGISHYYGELFSWPAHRPERPYRRYGLQVYDRARSSLFDYACALEVETICVHKRLD